MPEAAAAGPVIPGPVTEAERLMIASLHRIELRQIQQQRQIDALIDVLPNRFRTAARKALDNAQG